MTTSPMPCRASPGVRRAAYPPGWEDERAEGSVDANWAHDVTDSEAYGQRQVRMMADAHTRPCLPATPTAYER